MDFLTDIIPTKYRKYVYAVAALVAFGYGVWEASNGDWKQFAISLVGALLSSLAHANANEPAVNPDESLPDEADPVDPGEPPAA